MGSGTEQDRLMLDYLLGRLSEEDRLRVEEEYFQDDALTERLEFLEDRLIDEYMNEELSPRDRADYQRRFLASPRRLEKARLSQALRLAAAREQPQPAKASFWDFLSRPSFKTLALVSASVLLVWGWWIAFESRSELARVRETPARRLAEDRARQLQPGKTLDAETTAPGTPAKPVVAFLLYPGLSRGAPAAGRLIIPRGDVLVHFQLKLPDGAARPPYTLSLQNDDGNVIWSGEVRATGDSVGTDIAGAVLSEGDYLFVLETGRGPHSRRIASYQLSLLKQ